MSAQTTTRGGAERNQSRRRPAVAALMSTILPGAGQWYAGRRRRALLFVIPAVVLLAGMVWLYSLGPVRLLELLVQPRVLWVLLAINLALLLWRVLAVTDAFRVANGGFRSAGVPAILVAGVLVLAVAAPHIVFTSYGLEAIDLLESVFAGDGPVATVVFEEDVGAAFAPPFPPDDLAPTEVPDPAFVVAPVIVEPVRNMMFQSGVGDPDAVAEWVHIISGGRSGFSLLPPAETEGVDRITILLAGGDAGPGRSGLRTDTIIVATFDKTTGKAALFGIPRNLVQVPLPEEWQHAFIDLDMRFTPWEVRREWTDEDDDGLPDQFVPCNCFRSQINALYPFTRKWTETYPDEVDPGMAALRDTLEILLGIHIDYYALVNMSGFTRIIDALGGVRIYATSGVYGEFSPARAGEEWIEVSIRPGWNRLRGTAALAYVRERRSSSDYTRMARQRCLLKAVAAGADPVTIATRFTAITNAVKNSVRTDIPLSFVPTLVGYAADLDFDDIATVGFAPPFYQSDTNYQGRPVPDVSRIRAMVRWALTADDETSFAVDDESECRV